jgi:hypothetical protein
VVKLNPGIKPKEKTYAIESVFVADTPDGRFWGPRLVWGLEGEMTIREAYSGPEKRAGAARPNEPATVSRAGFLQGGPQPFSGRQGCGAGSRLLGVAAADGAGRTHSHRGGERDAGALLLATSAGQPERRGRLMAGAKALSASATTLWTSFCGGTREAA